MPAVLVALADEFVALPVMVALKYSDVLLGDTAEDEVLSAVLSAVLK